MKLEPIGTDAKTGNMVYRGSDGKHYVKNPHEPDFTSIAHGIADTTSSRLEGLEHIEDARGKYWSVDLFRADLKVGGYDDNDDNDSRMFAEIKSLVDYYMKKWYPSIPYEVQSDEKGYYTVRLYISRKKNPPINAFENPPQLWRIMSPDGLVMYPVFDTKADAERVAKEWTFKGRGKYTVFGIDDNEVDRSIVANPPSEIEWVSSVLHNDENATDEEMVAYFMQEGPMTEAKAKGYVAQRQAALLDMFYRPRPVDDDGNIGEAEPEDPMVSAMREHLAEARRQLYKGNPRSIWVGVFETPNFYFISFGGTKREAQKAMKNAWKEHCEAYQADPEYIDEYWDDAFFRRVLLGKGYERGDLGEDD